MEKGKQKLEEERERNSQEGGREEEGFRAKSEGLGNKRRREKKEGWTEGEIEVRKIRKGEGKWKGERHRRKSKQDKERERTEKTQEGGREEGLEKE